MLSGSSVAGFLARMVADFLDEQSLPAPLLRQWLGIWRPDGRVLWDDWVRCHALVGEISTVPAPGIHIGKHLKPSHMGVFGELVSHCGTLAEGLLYMQCYQRLIYDGNPSLVILQGSGVEISWGPGKGLCSQSTDDVALAMLVSMCRCLTGPDFCPLEVRISGDFSRSLDPYREYFRCHVSHGGDLPSLRLSQESMLLPVHGAEPARLPWLKGETERRLRELPMVDVFSRRLMRVLIRLLPRGKVSMMAVAVAMDMPLRELQQQLAARSLSFSAAMDSCRRELACHYLRQAGLSLGEVSSQLGFAEQSAFNRAFRRWYGMAPHAFRVNLVAEEAPDLMMLSDVATWAWGGA